MTDTSLPGRRRGAIAGLAVIAIAFAWLVFGGIDRNVVYFLTPAELLAKGSAAVDIPVRLGGQVKPGSVDWNEQSLDLRFTVMEEGAEVKVASVGAPPQMFRDGMGVVVEGRYGADGVFKSTNLMIKHSNEYRAPAEGEKPQEMYKTLFEATPK
jgi:cytochrome c-type biogenesis protein CcmE